MRVAVGQRLLNSVDGEEGSVWSGFGVTDEKRVDKLFNFEIRRGNVLDHGGEVIEGGGRVLVGYLLRVISIKLKETSDSILLAHDEDLR